MTNGIKKLNNDLDILQSMVEELANYLSSDVLFWPLFKSSYPKMTLGGYFMRQRRLQRLSAQRLRSRRAQADNAPM